MLSVIAVLLSNELNGIMVNDIPWLSCRGRRIQDINIIQCSQYSGMCLFLFFVLKGDKSFFICKEIQFEF